MRNLLYHNYSVDDIITFMKVTLERAQPLDSVSPDAFAAIDALARYYGKLVEEPFQGERAHITFFLSPVLKSGRTIFVPSETARERIIDLSDNKDAVEALIPIINATNEWTSATEKHSRVEYDRGYISPGDTLVGNPMWHIHPSGQKNIGQRIVVFSDVHPTLVAVGDLEGSLQRKYNTAIRNYFNRPEKLHDFTTGAVKLGALSVENAAEPYQGAGLTEATLHASPTNRENETIRRALLIIS
jgi:hypothetical protein